MGDSESVNQPPVASQTPPGQQPNKEGPGPGERSAIVFGYLALTVAVVAVVGRRATADGMNIAALELAGSSDRVSMLRGDVPIDVLDRAIAWDFVFIACYSALLIIASLYFAPRAFRLQAFRDFAHTALVLTAVGAGLDGLENAFTLFGLYYPGTDLPWQAAATASWAKWTTIAIVALYAALAMATYLITPAWVSKLLLEPPEPNVRMTPTKAAKPEDHVKSGTPGTKTEKLIQHARFGIAASGGGIRSASLVLGSLQRLDREYSMPDSSGPSWTTADKVASVSGGSYIAGGFSVSRSTRRDGSMAPRPSPTAWRDGTPEQAHLLGNLGYLLAPNPSAESDTSNDSATAAGQKPQSLMARAAQHVMRGRGTQDVPGVVAMVFTGLVLNAAVLFSLLWTLIQPYAWLLKSDVIGCRGTSDCPIQPFLVTPVAVWGITAAVVLLLWVAAGWVRGALQPETPPFRLAKCINRRLRPLLLGLVLLTALLALMLLGIPALITKWPIWLEQGERLFTPAVIAAIGSLIALARGLSRRTARFAPYVAGWLFVLVVLLVCVHWLINATYDDDSVKHFGVLVGAWLLLYTFVSAEWWSIAGFYRGRLRLAYATYRTSPVEAVQFDNGNGPPGKVEPSIYEMVERRQGEAMGSPLSICTAAHASTREIFTHYGLPSMSVTFSPETVRLHLPTNDEGGWDAHQASTALVEKLMFRRAAPRLTTMLGVGLSGAAISPAMGMYRIGPARMLLAVANVRLGMWIPNPKYAAHYDKYEPAFTRPDGPKAGVPYPRPRLSYLLKEFFGLHDPNDLYIYITDGGHWENTGLVELIRDRNIDEVVCLDADEKPRETATEIAAAISLAKLECNADIRLDLDVLRGPRDGWRGTDYSPQSVALGVITRGDHLGLLWYAKPVLTRETPLELLSYAEGDNTFPITSTIDQFFHTAQFKAYRDLGRHNAAVVIEARKALIKATCDHPTYADFCADLSPHWALVSIANLKLSEPEYGKLRALLAKGSTFATEGLSAMTAPERPRHAERWLTLLERRVIRGEWSPPGAPRITLTEYSQAWISQRSLEPRTRELYESQLRNHVEPYLGRKTLDTITPQTIRSWRQQLLKAGRSATVAAKSYRLLRAVLNTAVKEDQLIAENPCRIPGYDKEVSPGGRWARFRR